MSNKILDDRQSAFLVTRPQKQAKLLFELSAKQGWQAVSFCPLALVYQTEKTQQMQYLAQEADVIFIVSPSAVDMVMPHLHHMALKAKWVCVGQGSAKALQQWLPETTIHYPKDGHDSEAVLRLPVLQAMFGQKVLILRGQTGRNVLANALQQQGATVTCLSMYSREPIALDWSIITQLKHDKTRTSICVTSQEIVEQLFTQAPQQLHTYLKSLLYLSIHHRISDALKSAGIMNVVTCGADNQQIFAALQKKWET